MSPRFGISIMAAEIHYQRILSILYVMFTVIKTVLTHCIQDDMLSFDLMSHIYARSIHKNYTYHNARNCERIVLFKR